MLYKLSHVKYSNSNSCSNNDNFFLVLDAKSIVQRPYPPLKGVQLLCVQELHWNNLTKQDGVASFLFQ